MLNLLLCSFKVRTVDELAQDIDKVTGDDVRRVAAEMLQSSPTITALGDLSSLPRYDQFASALKA
jgi:predicted Zn-dependent peptidase